MHKKITKKFIAVVLAVLMIISAFPANLSAAPIVGSSDNGDGTYNNPVVWADIPDMSMIRVGDTYWMSSTTMHMNPGVPIMKSKDMVNWETVSYCYMVLDDTNDMNLIGGNMYKNGTWASSLNHRMVDDGNGGLKDEFILVVPSPTTNKTHIFKTSDPENEPWQRYDLPARYHDCAILLDDDGRNWMTWGTSIRELNSDLTGWMPGSSERRLIDTLHGPDPVTGVTPSSGLAEGLHMKKVDGMYYIIAITWPSGKPRTVVAHRAPSLTTPPEEWESKVVSQQDVNYGGNAGVAQGSILQAADGKWYGYAFRDSDAVGRIPWVVPVTWVEGWPMYGKEGSYTNLEPNYNVSGPIPVPGQEMKSIVASDEFYNGVKKPTYYDSNIIPHPIEAQAVAADIGDFAAARLAAGTEIVDNGGFETGNTNNWTYNNTFNDRATLTADTAIKNGGDYSVKVTERTTTGSGPMQDITGEIVAGGTYDVSFDIYYDHAAAPATKGFNMTLRLGSATGSPDDNRMQIMRGGTARKGQWTTISGQYTVPEGVDESNMALFFETGWVQNPTLDNDLFDFYVDNVSVKVVSEPGPADLVVNGGFEANGTANWTFNNTFGGDSATLTADNTVKNGGDYSVKVTDRTSTGSGPMQDMTGKIKAGGTYAVSFDIYYDHAAAPATKGFNMTLRLGSATGSPDDNRMQIMRGGTATKGQWTTISGEYTVPEGVDESNMAFFFETGWVQSPTLDNDLFDFYIDNVSVTVVSEPEPPEPPVDPEPTMDQYKYYGSNLNMAWQWNHNMDNRYWSLTDRPGFLRLETFRTVESILRAPNTVTQRTFGPESAAITSLDVSNMKDGDEAGIALFTAKYGSIGVKMEDGQKYLVTTISPGNNANNYDNITDLGEESARIPLDGDKVYLKAEANFVNQADRGNFFYSLDGINWTKLGGELRMIFHYANNHFMGYRFALYNFAKEETGGYVDFDYYRLQDKLTGATAPTVLGTAMTGESELSGVVGTTAQTTLMMDPLPAGNYSDIAASFNIPRDFTVKDVVFSDDVTGETSWKVTGNQLELSVTGDAGFAPNARAAFATIKLRLNKQASGIITLSVVPDYVLVKGDGNVAYSVDGVSGDIGFGTIPEGGAVDKPIGNPYLPLWEHLPDNEPRVFEDPDNPGKLRAYITGSHDVKVSEYCGPDIRQWSAPVEDLSDWRDEGPIFTYRVNENSDWDFMYAPDIVEVRRFAPEVLERGRTPEDERTVVEYYLYPHSRGANRRLQMVAKSDRPDGPFEPLNVNANGTMQSGSFIDFDPSVWVDYIDDPNDPDYETGFRAYVYYGFQESYAAELNQDTMWSRRPGTQAIRFFMPSSNGYGVVDYENEPPGTVYYALAPGEDPADYNFFEAASMRQIGNKYIMVYSGHSGPDYGFGPNNDSSTNSALRWAYGDTPMGPFKFGGVLVDSRGPVPNKNATDLVSSQWGHNTHGSLWEINGQWYTTYHRPVMGAPGNRQAVVAPLKIDWTEPSVLDGGTVTITGYDPYAEDERWTAKTNDGFEYDGAEITSEGFYVYGLPAYRYYSAGYVSVHQGTATVQVNRDIWDSHQPIINIRNGYRAGYKYFGFEGLDEWSKGILPFEGTEEGNDTQFNVWLTPKTNAAFTVQVWLDGPWANDTWNGKQIATINVPANAAKETTRFTVDVSDYVDGLEGKHAVYLVFNGPGNQDLCDMIGLGFSSDEHPIERYVAPTVQISVNGEAQEMPSQPVRSTNQNGYVDGSIYALSVPISEDVTEIPVITASADNADVTFEVKQAEALNGTAVVTFEYNGVVKTYKLNLVPPPAPRDAYTRIEAETFDDTTAGPQNENCSEGGQNVGYISGNSMWLKYDNVDFGQNGPVRVITRSAADSGTGRVSVRLDSPNGEIIATGEFRTSGGWQTWTDNVMEITTKVTGQHDVYLTFNGAQNINWLVFEEAAPSMSFSATMSETDDGLSVITNVVSGSGTIEGALVIAAVYNADGQLITVSKEALTLATNSSSLVDFSFGNASLPEGYMVKAFLWDAKTMIPITAPVEPTLR